MIVHKGMHSCPKCQRVERSTVTLSGDDVSVKCMRCGLSFGHRTTIDGVVTDRYDDRKDRPKTLGKKIHTIIKHSSIDALI